MPRSNYQAEHSIFQEPGTYRESSSFGEIKKYFQIAFNSSMTLHEFDFESVPKKYGPPILYALCISLISAFSVQAFQAYIEMASIESLYLDIPKDMEISQIRFLIFLKAFAALTFGAYIITIIGCKVYKIKYNSKIFGLIIASFTPIPLLSPFVYLMDGFMNGLEFAIQVLMAYYIYSSLLKKYGPFDQRMHVLTAVYFGISYFLITKIHISVALSLVKKHIMFFITK